MSDWLIEQTGEPWVPELPEDHWWADEKVDDEPDVEDED